MVKLFFGKKNNHIFGFNCRYCEWIEVTDEDNGQTYCYPIKRWIDKYINSIIYSDS
jgi:hypothetical protein